MTEKRFFILTDDEYDDTRPCIRDRTFKINDIYGDYKYDDLNEICNELNRLNNENEQLKQELSEQGTQLDFLKDENKHMRDLVNENEQLKQREKTLEGMIRTFDEGCKEIYDDKCRLEEENEQLKSDNKCYVKRYSELFDDYIAYKKENKQLKKQIERIDFILDDLNGAEYISRDDGIKALNKIDKVIEKR